MYLFNGYYIRIGTALGLWPQYFTGATAMPNESECTTPFETKATFGKSMGNEH